MKTFEPSGMTKANLLERLLGEFRGRRERTKSVPVDGFPNAARGLLPHSGPAMQHAVQGRHADACLPSDILQSEMACRHFARIGHILAINI